MWRASLGPARVALARGDAKEAARHAEEARDVLQRQRATVAPGSSTETIDRTLGEIAEVMASVARR